METLTEKKRIHSGRNQTRFAIASSVRVRLKQVVLKGFILTRGIKSEIQNCNRK